MKTYEYIAFNNKVYKGRRVKIKGWGNYLVASTLLNRKLMDTNSNYTSTEAKRVDEGIFFFINPNDFKLSDKYLARIILKSL
jgi:hypothetical protein